MMDAARAEESFQTRHVDSVFKALIFHIYGSGSTSLSQFVSCNRVKQFCSGIKSMKSTIILMQHPALSNHPSH